MVRVNVDILTILVFYIGDIYDVDIYFSYLFLLVGEYIKKWHELKIILRNKW